MTLTEKSSLLNKLRSGASLLDGIKCAMQDEERTSVSAALMDVSRKMRDVADIIEAHVMIDDGAWPDEQGCLRDLLHDLVLQCVTIVDFKEVNGMNVPVLGCHDDSLDDWLDEHDGLLFVTRRA